MAEVNFQNRTLYHGDNLDFLRGMNSETVHLIATDPPFNKNRDFHATPDSLARGAQFADRWRWDKDVHDDWIDKIQDDWPAVWSVIGTARKTHSDGMGAFLCWLGVRLIEMHRVLRSDGSIYLHIDHTAHAYVKALMDSIFGAKHFRNAITWKRTSGAKKSQYLPKSWGNSSDTILYFVKSDSVRVKPYRTLTSEEHAEKFSKVDHSRGERYFTKGLTLFRRPSQGPRPNLCFEWRGFKNRHSAGWALSKDRLEEEYQKGNIVIDGDKIERRKYERDYPGLSATDTWTDIPNLTGKDAELTGYPTQKPIALYERIIRASSEEGDIVLDPFCGCATTPVAAERLNRQWIGIDIWDEAYPTVLDRLVQEGLAVPNATIESPYLITGGKVSYLTELPVRTDDDLEAVPVLKLRLRRPADPWQKLSRVEMTTILLQAQGQVGGLVICAGCGRQLEKEFMELDHIQPRADGGQNDILNRILLCRPCNGKKGQYFTLTGLLRENRNNAWMKDEALAKIAQSNAKSRAEWVRDNFQSAECQELLRQD